MSRQKTPFRHINSEGKVIRVTKENDQLFIGNTNNSADGKMVHFRNVNVYKSGGYNSSNEEPDEFADYCWSESDY